MAEHQNRRRVAIVFSGGPAPAANAVISTSAVCFLNSGWDVLGIYDGYAHLVRYDSKDFPLVEGRHYKRFTRADLEGLRAQPGVCIRTSRTNPGSDLKTLQDLNDPSKTRRLDNIYRGLVSLGVEALISIGGDGTLRSSNLMVEYQKRLPSQVPRINVIHLPKTIDNDYRGIDFTFGYFTAVDVLAREVRNLAEDAKATSSYFIAEVMGRQPGWLAYGVGIAAEANLIFAVEDLDERTCMEVRSPAAGGGDPVVKKYMSMEGLADRIVRLMLAREALGYYHGTVVLAEGLADMMPSAYLEGVPRHESGQISLGSLDIGKIVAQEVAAEYKRRTGLERKVKGLQLGYEARCARPNAFDVMLGCSLGAGAHRAVVEKNLTGHMVTLGGQMDIGYVPFSTLISGENLVTDVRFIDTQSDFYRLARSLEAFDGDGQ